MGATRQSLSSRLGLLAICMALAAMAGCRSQSSPEPAAPRGASGPDRSALLAATSLPTLTAPAKPLDQYKGAGGLLIVFVDTQCPVAAGVLADLDDLPKTLDPQAIPVVVVNLDDARDAVEGFYQDRQISAPVVYDATTATKERWKITSVPTVVLVDANGREAYSGPAEWTKVASAAEAMLAKPTGSLKFEPQDTGYG